jgi:DNA-binding NarL/FixJ family response regulator
MNVLVTDDDEMTRLIYRGILAQFPQLKVNFAASTQEFHQLARKHRFDVIFLDCDLGDQCENGLDLLRWIRCHHQNTQVFMATSHCDTAFRQRCAELGATGLIPKHSDFVEKLSRTIEADLTAA